MMMLFILHIAYTKYKNLNMNHLYENV